MAAKRKAKAAKQDDERIAALEAHVERLNLQAADVRESLHRLQIMQSGLRVQFDQMWNLPMPKVSTNQIHAGTIAAGQIPGGAIEMLPRKVPADRIKWPTKPRPWWRRFWPEHNGSGEMDR